MELHVSGWTMTLMNMFLYCPFRVKCQQSSTQRLPFAVLDTGAVMAVMAESAFCGLFPEAVVQKSCVGLKTYMYMYTGERMETVGEANVQVAYQDQELKTLFLSLSWLCAGKWSCSTWQNLTATFQLYKERWMSFGSYGACSLMFLTLSWEQSPQWNKGWID